MLNKPMDSIGFVSQFDPELAAMMDREFSRQKDGLELIASENFASPAVIAAMGSILTNKYAEGLPGKRYYGGCHIVDEIEQLCIDRAKACFGAEFANVQPHSGAQANMAVQLALLQPGDTMMGMSLANGGHLSHGSPANLSGKYYNVVSYDVNHETGLIDYDQIRDMARKCSPKLMFAVTVIVTLIGAIAQFGGALKDNPKGAIKSLLGLIPGTFLFLFAILLTSF